MSRIPDLLFSEYDLSSTIEAHGQKLIEEIDALEANRLLNTNPDELLAYFEEKYHINVPKLDEANIQTDHAVTKVDVTRGPNRFLYDSDRPIYIEGTKITFFIAYEGDKDLFKCRPSTFTFNPPRAEIGEREISFVYQVTNHDADAIKKQFNREFEEVKKWLSWIEKDVSSFNTQLKGKAGGRITSRREKLIKDQGLAASLGFPMRRRDNAPQTYIVPTVKRKIAPIMLTPSKTPFVPEPTIEMKEYEYILQVISNMVSVMERSPGAFKSMGEEDLRQHFLVQLNGQYEGQATGETFNSQGKTDILIREKDRNVFIAECKFWHGPEELKKAIDQSLGYATWRDGKLALLIFNRDRALTTVLQKIPEVVKAHPNYIRQETYALKTGFRFIMEHKDDTQRELMMIVMVFEVPA